MKTPATDRELATAVAMHALEKFGKKHSDRGTLLEGASHEIDLKVTGTVDGTKVSTTINGEICVGHDNPTGSTRRPDWKRVFCAALHFLPKIRRERLLTLVQKSGVPEPDEEMLQIAEAINQSLSESTMKRGAVSYRPKAA